MLRGRGATTSPSAIRRANGNRWRRITVNWQLYLLVLLPVVWLVTFMYVPIYGNVIAFKRFLPALGIMGSPWVGLANFVRFFESYRFLEVLRNTFVLSLYDLAVGFPTPIILALLINYAPVPAFRKVVQTLTYAPHFISTVVMVGIIVKIFSARVGILNLLISGLGLAELPFLSSGAWFPHIYVWTNAWQHAGWGTIVYLAALAAVDPGLHESAVVDGASMWQRVRHVDIPGILPTAIVLLILRSGEILQVGFEKVFLMQNNLNIGASEVIQTYVYRIGIAARNPNLSYATAIGLFQNVVMFAMLLIVNRLARRLSDTSLW